MANLNVVDRIEALQSRREDAMQQAQQQPIDLAPVYSDSYLFQFDDYFYPAERVQLQTRDGEQFAHFDRPLPDIFADADDLNTYLDRLPNPSDSSHDEDQPPASEELFMSSPEIYEGCMTSTKYTPTLTQHQQRLLRDVTPYAVDERDSEETQRTKAETRRQLIAGYCKELKRKRYARRYRRWQDVRSRGLDLKDETMALIAAEVHDKSLNRRFYYSEYDPHEFLHVLIPDRVKAIKRKMLQYLSCPKWRRSYRNHVYYSVNADVPADDTRHMDGRVVLVDRDGVGTNELRGASGLSDYDTDATTDATMSIVNISEGGGDSGDDRDDIEEDDDDYVDSEDEEDDGDYGENEDVESADDAVYSEASDSGAEEAEESVDDYFDNAAGDASYDEELSRNDDNLEDYDYDYDEQYGQSVDDDATDAFSYNADEDAISYNVDGTFFDDNIPSSEEAEMSSECDTNPKTPGFNRPIPVEKREIFWQMTAPDVDDESKRSTIADYHVFLITKRRQEAINRLQSVRQMGLSNAEEARLLCEMELANKKLNRGYYYEPGEPRAYARILFNRRRAIRQKFRNYAEDPEFAEAYRRRVMSDIDREP